MTENIQINKYIVEIGSVRIYGESTSESFENIRNKTMTDMCYLLETYSDYKLIKASVQPDNNEDESECEDINKNAINNIKNDKLITEKLNSNVLYV